MADWVNIPETSVEPGAPARSSTVRAFRDNPIAIAEGASGAPRIQTAAINNNAVTTAKIANGNVTSGKLATGNSERDWVLARTASAAVGVVGTYALLFNNTLTNRDPGGTVAGSDLIYSSAGNFRSSGVPAGTWRCMGAASGDNSGPDEDRVTLWLRIA